MIPVDIAKLLTSLAETPTRLAAMSSRGEEARLHGKVSEAEWTVNEILAHLRVCAEVWGKSILAMISQDQPTLRYVSPRIVAKKRDYTTQAFAASLQTFSQQRNELLQQLTTLDQAAWSRGATFTGTIKGREQTIFSYVQRIVDHEAAHLQQIEEILNGP